MKLEDAQKFMEQVFRAIEHGDEKHRVWLREKCAELAPELVKFSEKPTSQTFEPLTTAPGTKSCNRHSDCDEAEAKAEAEGKPERFGPGSVRLVHCTVEDCEDCYGC